MKEHGATAIIEDGCIVIRVPTETLSVALEGAWAMNKMDQRWKVTNAQHLAEEMVRALNQEDEQGTTSIHEMLDQAVLNVIESGGYGIDLHEQQSI